MGNQALKQFGIETERIPVEKYDELKKEILEKLSPHFSRVIDVRAFKNKKTFGDIDIIASPKENSNINYSELFKELFNYNAIYPNKPVYSFDYNKFQVDVIITKERIFDMSYTYYNYNDLGNMMGRVAHKFGLKYGFEGLLYPIRSENQDKIIGEFELSINPEKIFTFLGWDFNVYLNGFNELQDIFDYVVTGKYFNPEIYEYSALNNQNRVRNKKRESYRRFLEFINLEQNKLIWQKENRNFFQFNPNKSVYFDMIDKAFPEADIKGKVEICKEKEAELNLIRSKFNGNIVSELTKLSGDELGLFIAKFKKQFSSNQEFEKYILISPVEEIKRNILNQ